MIIYYPDLFKTQGECLDHLFLVIGNGYVWSEGELVYPTTVFSRDVKLTDEAEITRRIDSMAFNPEDLYPYSPRHSKITNYPDDIKLDWLEAIDLARFLFAEHMKKED